MRFFTLTLLYFIFIANAVGQAGISCGSSMVVEIDPGERTICSDNPLFDLNAAMRAWKEYLWDHPDEFGYYCNYNCELPTDNGCTISADRSYYPFDPDFGDQPSDGVRTVHPGGIVCYTFSPYTATVKYVCSPCQSTISGPGVGAGGSSSTSTSNDVQTVACGTQDAILVDIAKITMVNPGPSGSYDASYQQRIINHSDFYGFVCSTCEDGQSGCEMTIDTQYLEDEVGNPFPGLQGAGKYGRFRGPLIVDCSPCSERRLGNTPPQAIPMIGNKNASVMYPNPTSDLVHLDYTLNQPASNIVLRMVDQSGKVVLEKTKTNLDVGQHQLQFNTDPLPSGMYYNTLYIDGKKYFSHKLMVID